MTPRTKDEALDRLESLMSTYGGFRDAEFNAELRQIHGLLSGEIPEFVRDHARYIVIKTGDVPVAKLEALRDFMVGNGIKNRTAVVIEKGTPEYEPVWEMVADRVQKEQAKKATE